MRITNTTHWLWFILRIVTYVFIVTVFQKSQSQHLTAVIAYILGAIIAFEAVLHRRGRKAIYQFKYSALIMYYIAGGLVSFAITLVTTPWLCLVVVIALSIFTINELTEHHGYDSNK